MIKSFSVSATCAAILVASLSASSAFASTHHASHRESVLGMNRYYALVGQSRLRRRRMPQSSACRRRRMTTLLASRFRISNAIL